MLADGSGDGDGNGAAPPQAEAPVLTGPPIAITVLMLSGRSARVTDLYLQETAGALYRKVADAFDLKDFELELCHGPKVIAPNETQLQELGLSDGAELMLVRRRPLLLTNPGESRYNRNYFCKVQSIEEIGLNVLKVTFEVVGDMSLGPLQPATGSRLSWRNHPTWQPSSNVCRPSSCEYNHRNEESKIAGSLIYTNVPTTGPVAFEYGTGGYDRLYVDLSPCAAAASAGGL